MTPSPSPLLDRRRLLQGAAGLGGVAALGLEGCSTATGATAGPLAAAPALRIAPIRASVDRLFDVTVCLRPFRAAGPRLEAEEIGRALVVHNYGHGGSGWSLSWGSAEQAVAMAMTRSPARIAVVGCGAIGLTSAITAQEAGAQVTIYARDLLPQTRSARATGAWTPDSRIALASAGPAFAARWEAMARTSWKTYRRYLGLPGDPVEWIDRYVISDAAPGADPPPAAPRPDTLDFASYEERLADVEPRSATLTAGASSIPFQHVRRGSQMIFNLAEYGRTLLADFHGAGGRIVRREFFHPAELGALEETVVINCPGYAARTLMADASVTPVRGQIGWLIPQPEARYAAYFDHVGVVSRRDGIVVQDYAGGDMRGYGDADETPDRAEAEAAVRKAAALFSGWRT